MAAKAADPLGYLCDLFVNPRTPADQKYDIAKELLPYQVPRLKAVDVNASQDVKVNVQSDLKTPEKAVEAAREVVMGVGRGELSLSQANAYVALLERLAGMQGYLALERLRAELEELKAGRDRPRLAFDQSHLPPESRLEWGQGLKSE